MKALKLFCFVALLATGTARAETQLREFEPVFPTAQSQSQKKTDVDLTKSIRRTLTKDQTLSKTAKNIQIITLDNEIVLRGPVETVHEKKVVERAAKKYAGDYRITNELFISE